MVAEIWWILQNGGLDFKNSDIMAGVYFRLLKRRRPSIAISFASLSLKSQINEGYIWELTQYLHYQIKFGSLNYAHHCLMKWLCTPTVLLPLKRCRRWLAEEKEEDGDSCGKARVCVFAGVWVEQGWCCSGGARIEIDYWGWKKLRVGQSEGKRGRKARPWQVTAMAFGLDDAKKHMGGARMRMLVQLMCKFQGNMRWSLWWQCMTICFLSCVIELRFVLQERL